MFGSRNVNKKSDSRSKFAIRFGKSLAKKRRSAGLTQEQLADRANISWSYVGHIETGRFVPNLYTTKQIASALNISVSELVDDL